MTVPAFLAVVLALCGLGAAAGPPQYIVRTFDASPANKFNHMTLNKNTQDIYIGAVDRLYKLSPELVEEASFETGPRKDNPKCPPPGIDFSCQFNVTMSHSYNKALLIDYRHQKLIACSSLYQGFCQKYFLENLTETSEVYYESVVANNATASTVAYIAPGPGERGEPRPDVLYVSATATTTGMKAYRDRIPAFCSRNLTDFGLTVRTGFRKSKVDIEALQKEQFPVRYIAGFHSDNFSYMVSVQKINAQDDRHVSKLLRVCSSDAMFYSYTEVRLECNLNGVDYNLVRAVDVSKSSKLLAEDLKIDLTKDVLYAVFDVGVPNSAVPTGSTALCIYSLEQIRKKFTENIKHCFQGEGFTGPNHIIQPSHCNRADYKISDDYCGSDINTPIDGEFPITANATLVFPPSTFVTSIVTTITHDYTVAFVGTRTGHVKKVVIESLTSATLYDRDVPLDPGSPVLADMALDESKTHLYAQTERKIVKMAVQNCSQYTTCFDCLGSRDPYCGWCSLENRCSLKKTCQNFEVDMRWLHYSGQKCTNITEVMPREIQIDHSSSAQLLRLTVVHLPVFTDSKVECMFSYTNDYAQIITPANKTGDGVQCMTPLFTQLPAFHSPNDHIVMEMSVRVSEQVMAKTNFTFFDCSLHTSCTSCTQSKFPCTWCIRHHMCIYSNVSVMSCRNDSLVTGMNTPGNSLSPGPQSCPRIQLESGGTEILVPAKTDLEVKVQGFYLKRLPLNHRLQCFFKMHGGMKVSATWNDSLKIITCKSNRFDYLRNVTEESVPFDIQWEDNKPLDNPTNVQVKMYKCQVMARTCGDCFTLQPKFSCGWCGSACTIRDYCRVLSPSTTWLDRGQACPNPTISSFTPQSGPRSGGTILTIHGSNLGQSKNMVSVDIGGVPCTIISFTAPSIIKCRTGAAKYNGQNQSVSVAVNNQYHAQSAYKFSYVEPVIHGISPDKGPLAGGTRITIHGHHMDAGSNISISLGKSQPCHIPTVDSVRTRDKVVCITPERNETNIVIVSMVIDEQNISPSGLVPFQYVENPSFSQLDHSMSIKSGGLNLTMMGKHLDSVQAPTIILWYGNQALEGPCHKVQGDASLQPHRLVCSTPRFPFPISGEFEEVSFGFRMDGVTSLLNLSREEHGTLKVYPDPVVTKFDPQVKSFPKKNDVLVVDGMHFKPAVREQDILVMVGQEYCNISSVASDVITCRPPPSQPGTLMDTSYPEVVVFIGNNFNDTLGFLKYEEPETMSLRTIILIAVGLSILLIAIIIVIVILVVRSRKSDDMMKKMRIQMDSLEARVANECKEAFAELQTDMTELTSDLDSGHVTIPFWDYRTYCMKVLFPGQEDHPVVRDLQINIKRNREEVERGLKLFQQLMGNKTFLLIFIRTLESNRNFYMRDRVNVASLISIALQTKMEYSTDILKTLLAELIERSIEGKNHPKLLLRRNESVAEKMLTNWFTFLLYRFLRECAGEPLFMLYQAIKQQVSKGPVDAVTSEARYSLSEDKLIRQQINFRPMTLQVLDLDRFPQQSHPVKVLDCDTISQVKEKILDAIFKNTASSSRPPKEELDLVLFDHPPEWVNADKSHPMPYPLKGARQLVLHDEDGTSKMEGDYKRLNTLSHYQVPDGAFVALVTKQNTPYNNSLVSDKSVRGYGQYPSLVRENISFYNRSPSLNRSVTPQTVSVDMDNNTYKVYHLVKQHDNDVHNKDGDRGSKMVTEIYLPRLLVTKGTLQQFVDDLFERIFSTAHRGTVLPLAIKYMFDFLDDQALLHNIQDMEVIHIWKSNSLPLRFWVNVIKNPNFVFDIFKSNIVDSCLTVIGQTFMDCCSVSEHRLGKDSPSSKLLYAKDIPKYKKWVERYYQDIKMIPAISDQDMTAMLTEESRLHMSEFNTDAALMELYKFVQRFKDDIMTALEEDEFAKRSKLNFKLDQVISCMEGDTVC